MKKISLTKVLVSFLVLLILGLGEYAFIEFYPLTPEQRWAKARTLPVVASFVKASDMRLIQDAIDDSPQGYLTMNTGGEHERWATPEELYADYEAGDHVARQMLGYIRNWDEITAGMERTRQLAEDGEPSAMFQLYMQGRHLTGVEDVERAVELLEQEDTPTTRWYLEALVRHSVDLRSREGMLLMAEMMQENYCSSQLSADQCREGAKRNREGLAALRSAAADGDPDANWVVDHLSEDQAEVRINS